MKKILAALVLWAAILIAAPSNANALPMCEPGYQVSAGFSAGTGVYFWAACEGYTYHITMLQYMAMKLSGG